MYICVLIPTFIHPLAKYSGRKAQMSRHQQQPQPALKPGDVFPASRDPTASAERERALAHEDDQDRLLVVAETQLPGGKRIVTSSAKGQVLSQFAVPAPAAEGADLWGGGEDKVTIGEALEAAAAAGASADKQVGRSDAAAVQAAETRATRQGRAAAGGVAAATQKAAEANARTEEEEEEEKVKISDVLRDASARLEEDKVVTREDAERVAAAEKRNREEGEGEGPVAAAMEAASRMNRGGVA